uniref:Radical SAM protein n=1 Tax=candidate division CPR3 bacterium TaxID=2268181 RepID=A0A7V3J975_UNCC3
MDKRVNAIELSNGWVYVSDSHSWRKVSNNGEVGYLCIDVDEKARNRVFNRFVNAQREYIEKSVIPLGFILVTNQCNKMCDFCYANANTDEEKRYVDVRDIEKLVCLVGNKDRTNSVAFSGGEPLLYWEEVIEPVISKVLGGGGKIYTNGELLDEDKAKKLVEWGTRVYVAFDLGYSGAGHGDDVLEKLGYLSRRVDGFGSLIDLSVCIAERDFDKTIDFDLPLDVCGAVDFNVVSGSGKEFSEEIVKNEILRIKNGKDFRHSFLYRYLKWIIAVIQYGFKLTSCDVTMNLNYRGDVMLCHEYGSFYDLNDRYEEMKVDSIKNLESVIDLDTKIKDKAMKSRLGFPKDECFDCVLKYWCGGICWANVGVNNYLCDIARKAFPFVLDFVVSERILSRI